MTNREYLEQKKEDFFDKLSDWFDKYFKFIYIVCLVLEVLSFVFVLKVSVAFLGIFIPWTILCLGFTFALVELWLDEEHKEKNRYD